MTLDAQATDVEPDSMSAHRWVVCLSCWVVRPVYGSTPSTCAGYSGDFVRCGSRMGVCEGRQLMDVDRQLAAAIDGALVLGGYDAAREALSAWTS